MSDMADTPFARRLRSLRAEARLSQEQLAARVGVDRQTVSNWEKGENVPSLAKAWDLADVFKVTLDRLAARD